MIPKVIHYCWFGGNPKPEIVQKCIQSWETYLPDYEIIEWNEQNFDVRMIPYTATAYEKGKWAFVSDFARLYVVYHYGGIYLDTDVLLSDNKLNELLQYGCWLAQEDMRYIATGLGFGAIKGHPLIGAVAEAYKEYEYPCGTNGERDTRIIEQELPQWKKSNKSLVIGDVMIVGRDDYSKYARHLYAYSWAEKEVYEKKQKELLEDRPIGWRRTLKWKIGCLIRSPKIFTFMERHRGSKMEKFYMWFAYDFFAYGPSHYIKQLVKKITKNNKG